MLGLAGITLDIWATSEVHGFLGRCLIECCSVVFVCFFSFYCGSTLSQGTRGLARILRTFENSARQIRESSGKHGFKSVNGRDVTKCGILMSIIASLSGSPLGGKRRRPYVTLQRTYARSCRCVNHRILTRVYNPSSNDGYTFNFFIY